ncbi:MAG: sigma-54-dependent Fis family transcriptional regulator [Phycisphaeraceae bacterium]|nr:sigma-54-dependent Fis family transcriptional regulator [Phycisphaerales bacterium]MCA9305461.1 sigma-54-dependent Fis family transcriptional regulator [Phycisphaerales bacterium]MCB9842925.1 sigma-54-dependent Fis family transcriptional regulator [Phycisphaeraceae bacterium]
MSTVLVVDDKEMLRDSIALTLSRAGFTVIAASDGGAALDLIARRHPDAVVTDLKMPGMTGVELIEKIREMDDDLPVVLMTAFGTIETAVKAIKLGAFDYITKPFEGDELVVAVKRAIEHAVLKRENTLLRLSGGPAVDASAAGGLFGVDRILGESHAIKAVKEKVRSLAASQGTVLIAGESGTGKEVLARAIHEESARAASPFIGINCAAMSESLLESELFGHERGAFTGADRLRKGRFELAHGGTLLLDEISEVRPQVQAKLLRVLQERAFERVGSSTTLSVDVRVIATTNRELREEVSAGAFRQDLYFRLNVLPVHLPPLRERIEDVRVLATHFVAQIAEREGRGARRLSDHAMDLLLTYDWPGNVRELQNLCERAVVLAPREEIGPELIAGWLSGPPARAASRSSELPASPGVVTRPLAAAAFLDPQGHPKQLAEIEREVIVETLTRFEGHRQKTARALGIGVRTLGLKIKKWKEEQLVAPTL